MDEGQRSAGGLQSFLHSAGINRTAAYQIGIALAVLIAVLALAAGAAYLYRTPAVPAVIETEPPAPTSTDANIAEASGNPAEKIPETNPFKKADNPFDSYTNPFE